MADFGSMKRHNQQRVIIEKIRHADSIAENVDAAADHIVYCLPFIMTAEPDDAIEDDARLIAIQALTQHKICKSALMELTNVRQEHWGKGTRLQKTKLVLRRRIARKGIVRQSK